MMKTILALLGILVVYTLQVLAQDCISPDGPFRHKKKVQIKVINNVFVPDCLTVYDGQSVVWVWGEDGSHTITSNAVSFGDCTYDSNVLFDYYGDYKGTKVRLGPFKYDPDEPLNNEFYYQCTYHCYNGMYGKIQVVEKNK